MKCPKCEIELINGCCLRCGYLPNGNQIKYNYETIDKFKEQKLFNKNFDTMYRNEKLYINFILGPLYFSYRGHFILGTISVFIDFLLFWLVGNIAAMFSFFPIIMCVYMAINRIIYSGFSNVICLLIDNIRIKSIKKRCKDNYLEKLKDYKHKKIYLLLTILFYLIPIVIFALLRRYQNGML